MTIKRIDPTEDDGIEVISSTGTGTVRYEGVEFPVSESVLEIKAGDDAFGTFSEETGRSFDYKVNDKRGESGPIVTTDAPPEGTKVIDVTLEQVAGELAQAAIRDPYAMGVWKGTFPTMCPGCFKPHALMSRIINRGLCVLCHVKKNKALAELAANPS